MVFCSAAMVAQKLLNQIKNWTNIRIGIQNITKNNFSEVDYGTLLSEPLKKTHENMKKRYGTTKETVKSDGIWCDHCEHVYFKNSIAAHNLELHAPHNWENFWVSQNYSKIISFIFLLKSIDIKIN